MSWWAALPAIATAIALLLIPGLLFSAALRARGPLAVGLVPMFSVALAGVTGIVAAFLGLEWSVLTFLLLSLVLCAIAFGVTRLVDARFTRTFSPRLDRFSVTAGLVGLAIGGAASVYNISRALGAPDNIAQRYDNVYHLNAVRYVLEEGQASSLTLGRMVNPDAGIAIYPAAWHSFASIVAQLSGQSIPVAINALNIVICSLVWPLSAVLLTRVIVGPRPFAVLFAGIFAAAFPAFPLGLLDFGPLYPNLLSYSILPAVLAVVVSVLKSPGGLGFSPMGSFIALAAGLSGLFTAQPNGFSALLALSVPPLVWKWWTWARTRYRTGAARSLVVPGVVAVMTATAFLALWRALLITGYDNWLPFNDSRWDAIGEALTSAPHGRDAAVVLGIATAAGIVGILKGRAPLWLIGVFAVAVLLYVIAASEPRGFVRMALTGSWYQDPQRLASLLPIPTIVVAAFGAAYLLTGGRRLVQRVLNAGSSRRRASVILAGMLTLAFVALGALYSQRGPIDQMVLATHLNHTYAGNPTILSPAERELLERLDEVVPDDAVVGVNPWNGSALAYAFSGTEVTQYHMGKLSTNLSLIARELDSAGAASEACAVAEELGVKYVLDFGDYYLLDRPLAHSYPAFDEVDGATNYELVDEEGDAKLYQVTNCG